MFFLVVSDIHTDVNYQKSELNKACNVNVAQALLFKKYKTQNK